MTEKEQLFEEIRKVINRNGLDTKSDTPDFILAEMVLDFIVAYSKAVKGRDNWFGYDPWDNEPLRGEK